MNSFGKRNRVIEWIDYRLPILTFLRHELQEYPTPFSSRPSFWC
jgi:hypothetical protein